MMFLYAFLILLAIAVPLFVIYRRVKSGHRSKRPLIANLCAFFGVILAGGLVCLSQSASAAEVAAAAGESLVNTDAFATGMGYLAAAISVAGSGLAGAMAVTASASAAIGAISENEGVFGKCLIFVGLAEGLALYGLLIGFMIISKL